MTIKRYFSVFLFIIFIVSFRLYGQNPFVSPKHDKSTKIEEVESKNKLGKVSYPMFIKRFLVKINKAQMKLRKKMSKLFNDLKEKKSHKALFILLSISFIYGILHALGPGHGKTVIVSYFISRHANIIHGFISGGLIGVLHAFSALIIIATLYFVISASSLTNFENINMIVKIVSALLIIGIGLFFLIQTIYRRYFPNKKNNEYSKEKNNTNIKGLIAIAIAVGIVPCPGAAIILLFSINKNIIMLGILSVILMSIGMALTISVIAVLTIKAKHYALQLTQEKSSFYKGFAFSTKIFGNILIIIFGIILLLSSV